MIVIIVCVIARFRLTGLILFSLFFYSISRSLTQLAQCMFVQHNRNVCTSFISLSFSSPCDYDTFHIDVYMSNDVVCEFMCACVTEELSAHFEWCIEWHMVSLE